MEKFLLSCTTKAHTSPHQTDLMIIRDVAIQEITQPLNANTGLGPVTVLVHEGINKRQPIGPFLEFIDRHHVTFHALLCNSGNK